MKKALYVVAVIATVAIAGWNYQQNKEVELSDLALANVVALANVEALTNGEGGSGSGYCTMHIPCFNSFGNPTGKYSASSYSGPNCNGPYHSHSCTSCNHV